jgi:hypothetical protein
MVRIELCRIRRLSISEYKAKHKMNCAEAVKVSDMLWKAGENRSSTHPATRERAHRTGNRGTFAEASSLDFQWETSWLSIPPRQPIHLPRV